MAKVTVADLEVLFSANVGQVEKADKQIVAIGKKVESNPIKVSADASPFEQSMARAEASSKKMSKELVRDFLESDRAAKKSADEIERVLVKSYGVAEDAARDLALATKGELMINADPKPALSSMDRVEKAAKKLVSADTALKLDADITRAEKSLERTKQRLEDLQVRALGGLDVTADVKRAQTQLQKTERQLKALTDAKQMIVVDANTEPSEQALGRVRRAAGKAGEDSGDDFGKNIIAALASIPIAGAVVGLGVAAGKALIGAFNDGLQVEARQDRLQALTGINESAALRLGRAAGEAYANNFGESIESNMDATRLALQFRILDPKSTTRDAQLVVQGLTGIADVLGEDVRPIAQAVTQMLSTGMAKNAQEAYDIIAAGARNGINRSEDLLDTLTEYPALFQRLGLKGDEALGLINQGMRAGARNSDLAADALKEFQIRATDASETSAEGFKALGLDAEEMTAKIARGGKDARDGLAVVLDKLRETEDPVKRNAAAVALFGTQAEDLGAALFAMDLSTAVEQLDGVTGSAQRMFDTLADNDASKVATAQRNIEVAAEGIKGALAGAFSEPLGDFAEWVSQNRGPLLQFFVDLVNGAIDFGITASESFGAFVSGPLATAIDGLKQIIKFTMPWTDTSDLDEFIDGMRGFESETDKVADGLEAARKKFNGFAEEQVKLGYLHDATLRTADSVSQVGIAADGATLSIFALDTANLRGSESGRKLKQQLDDAAAAFEEQIDLARDAGESQENLTDRYNSTRQALVDQMVAMGLTQEQAQTLIDTVLQTPEEMSTEFTSNADAEKGKVVDLGNKIVSIPDGSFTVTADTGDAYERLMNLQSLLRQVTGNKSLHIATGPGGQGGITQHDGGVVIPMAAGGALTPMAPIAQAVPPNTWRIVGDRMKDREFYIPDDGSARSMSVLLEAMRSFGLMQMADGGILGAGSAAAASPVRPVEATFVMPPGLQEAEVVRAAMFELAQMFRGA
ncbi:phage tail tape measure protein [Microbacterium sp. YJN-G]|uniref:phage tail tape measure protein n=1 Tax=Microbacterium sp. YJN-G TaxID=2763257 RepID=UPI001D0C01AF|nr:phage tail tape measure protein [Microbacterium sp. YJN-G]